LKEIDYIAPSTVAEASTLLAQKGAQPLAGGTDIIVQVRENRRDVDLLVDLKNIPEVNELSYDTTRGLTLGASVPCYRIYQHPTIPKAYPGLNDAASLIGGIQIQSRASVGGNLCNASPAADSIPALIAHEASAVVALPNGQRDMVPVEKFCTGPGRNVLGRGEFLLCLHLRPPKPNSGSAYLRFIPRNEMDIAVVGVGVALTLDEKKTTCVTARIALGAVAPTPLLAADAAAALTGSRLTESDTDKAAALAQATAKPISDMRGDADYRRHLVGVLVSRAVRKAIERAKGG
jgi:carbon-monoxide dehydrogenase medium subunit